MEETVEAQACGGFLQVGARKSTCAPLPSVKELSLVQQVLAATAGGIATALFGSFPPCGVLCELGLTHGLAFVCSNAIRCGEDEAAGTVRPCQRTTSPAGHPERPPRPSRPVAFLRHTSTELLSSKIN